MFGFSIEGLEFLEKRGFISDLEKALKSKFLPT